MSLAGAWLNAAVAPVLVLSALGLGALGVGLRQPLLTGCGVLVALTVAQLQHRRVTAAQDRLVRMRTRLRLVRSNTDAELAAQVGGQSRMGDRIDVTHAHPIADAKPRCHVGSNTG